MTPNQEDLRSLNLRQIPRARLQEITSALIGGLGEIKDAIVAETTLHTTVRTQQLTIQDMSATIQRLNTALADLTTGSISNEEFYLSALEEIKALLAPGSRTGKLCHKIAAVVEGVLPDDEEEPEEPEKEEEPEAAEDGQTN